MREREKGERGILALASDFVDYVIGPTRDAFTKQSD